MRPKKFCFQYFVGLQKVWLQEGFRGFTKFEKYFSNPTTLWLIRLDEWLSLLYVSAQSHSSLELHFLPVLSFNTLQVLQGMVGIPLPPWSWCTSLALCLRCSCRTCHIKLWSVVICAYLRWWHPTPGKSTGVEEPGRLQSMGSRRVRHDWATSLWLFTFMHWRRKWQLTPVFLPGESQGWGSLVGCRLWGHTESDTTEAT